MNGRDRRFEALTGGHLTPARYGGPPLFVPSMVAPALRRARGAGGEPMVDNTARRRLITDSDQTMTVAVARAMSKSAELLDIAAELDLYRVSIELVSEREDAALEVVEGMGFKRVATLPGRIRDYFGSYKELVVLEVALSDRSTWWKE